MPLYLVRVDRHHSVETPPYRFMVDAHDDLDALVQGYQNCIVDITGGHEAPEDKLRAAVEQLQPPTKDRRVLLTFDDEDNEGIEYNLTLWHEPPNKPGEEPNIGIGEQQGLNKYENRWFHAAPWTPDPARQATLRGWPAEKLIDRILLLEALFNVQIDPAEDN